LGWFSEHNKRHATDAKTLRGGKKLQVRKGDAKYSVSVEA
jgi:hypothetical protein